MSKLDPAELDERLSNGESLYLLAVRPHADYQRERLEGSHNVPVYDDLCRGDEAGFRESITAIPDGATVITVCKAGIVARRATTVLEDEGYDAMTLAGGMRGWNGYRNGSIGYRLRSAIGALLP
jgi:rhodanese-related sulfurtransferase